MQFFKKIAYELYTCNTRKIKKELRRGIMTFQTCSKKSITTIKYALEILIDTFGCFFDELKFTWMSSNII